MASRTGNNHKGERSNGANLGFEEKLWRAADKLRSNMDAAEYKHVVLGLVFLKYISDAFQERYDTLKNEQYADPEDRDEYQSENVFWLPKEARWPFLQANAKQSTIGKLIDDAMVAIERDNPSLKGVLPKDYARPTLDKQRLGELIDLVGTIGLGDKESRSKDILGRVYEYFLDKFASAEGKKGGQFYTARCVVRLLVEMISPYKGRVFDPCCGSGGMFVQSEKFIEAHGGLIGNVSIYGQESNPTTWRLAKMNLAIRGIEANLGPHNADSFHNDLHKDLKADYILANPPFNDSDWGGEQLREDARWKYGTPPSSNANFAWVQHFISHLSPSGIAGFVLAQVSLSSESNIENDIRAKIIEDDIVDCIVTLPGKLFYSTPIPVCLWFISRNRSNSSYRNRTKEVLFIDASRLGTPENRTQSYLTDSDIEKISSIYHSWREKDGGYQDIAGFCRSVSLEEIREAEYSLFPARYITIDFTESSISGEELLQRTTDKVIRHQERYNQLLREISEIDNKLSMTLQDSNLFTPRTYAKLHLSEILEVSDERLGKSPEPEILTCTERAGLILQKERFAKRVATEDTSKYKVVHKTDIVYNPYLLWAGAIDQCWIVDLGITSPAYEVLRVKEGYDPTLIGFLLKSQRLLKMYDGISVGTVQRRRRAPVERFLQLEVTLPSREDQQKFTNLSTSVQRQIALLRDMAKEAAELNNDLCNNWLRANGE